MKLELRSKGVRLTRDLTEHVDRQVSSAMRRFGNRVERVRVQLTDLNGPRGGEDIHCRIQAQLAPRGELLVHEVRASPFSAVARATARFRSSLARKVNRGRWNRNMRRAG